MWNMRIRAMKLCMSIAAIVLLGVFLQSCGAGNSHLPHRWYNSAEIYWQREAPWGIMRPHLYDVGSVLSRTGRFCGMYQTGFPERSMRCGNAGAAGMP